MAAPTLEPRAAAVRIVRALCDRGHAAYLAGGCVRDELLGLRPKDYDVATDAPPDVVRARFRGARRVGEAFGVVLVRLGGQAVEVATFRAEWGYEDGRRPTQIQFTTDAQHDAQRRDFTINGLFLDPVEEEATSDKRQATSGGTVGGSGEQQPTAEAEQDPHPGPLPKKGEGEQDPHPASGGPLPRKGEGEEAARVLAVVRGRVIDYVGGLDDLRAGIVRAIGAPRQRFAEDYLRLLRAARFAARFGFRIEPATLSAIRQAAPRLSAISRERIGQEMLWMLTGPNPALAAQWVQRLLLDGPVFQEPSRDALLPTVETLSPAVGYPVMLAAWLLDRHWLTPRGAPPREGEAPAVREGEAPAVREGEAPAEPPGDAVVRLGGRLALPAAPGAPALARSLRRFLHDQAPAILRRWRAALCLSNEHDEQLQATLHLAARGLHWLTLGVAERKRLLAQAHWPMALLLLRALKDQPGAGEVLADLDAHAPLLQRQGVAPPALITGDDLIALGRRPGPAFKKILDQAYDRQLDGRLPDRAAALRWLRALGGEERGA